MKKLIMLSTLFVAMIFVTSTSNTAVAQDMPGLDKSPMDMAYFPPRAAFRAFEKDAEKKAKMAPVMRVIYSRPQKKGRKIIGNLVKEGEVWRAGANESTELNVFKASKAGDVTLEPGRYSLYTLKEGDKWTLIINSDLDNWGAYAYNEASDVVRVEGVVSKLDSEVESLTMMFKGVEGGAHLVVAWGKNQVEFPFYKP